MIFTPSPSPSAVFTEGPKTETVGLSSGTLVDSVFWIPLRRRPSSPIGLVFTGGEKEEFKDNFTVLHIENFLILVLFRTPFVFS